MKAPPYIPPLPAIDWLRAAIAQQEGKPMANPLVMMPSTAHELLRLAELGLQTEAAVEAEDSERP